MRILPLFIFIVINTCLFSQEQNWSGIYESTEGYVHFVSDAPLELIEASSNELKGLLRAEDRTFAFTIPTRSFKGFNSPLQQEHFYENYIESDLYPQASFQGKIIEPVNLLEEGSHTVRAKGIFDIHGVKKERVIRVNLKTERGSIVADADFEVLLEDHNITIPKMVFHKISENIRVHVNIVFEQSRKE